MNFIRFNNTFTANNKKINKMYTTVTTVGEIFYDFEVYYAHQVFIYLTKIQQKLKF